MPKYLVTVYEVHSYDVAVEATSEDKAREMVYCKINDENSDFDAMFKELEYGYTLEPDLWRIVLAP